MAFPKSFFRWRPHPWHGLNPRGSSREIVDAYIEMTPFDSVKYEVDKTTGYLRVDRPQLTSSMPPTLYGFIPQTFCGEHVQELSPHAKRGDGDPLDICVLTERPISRGEVILRTRIIGGLRMVDHGEADDKIIGVLDNDPFWKDAKVLEDLPETLLSRLCHYFATYKHVPGDDHKTVIDETYSQDHALRVLEAALMDYDLMYGAG